MESAWEGGGTAVTGSWKHLEDGKWKEIENCSVQRKRLFIPQRNRTRRNTIRKSQIIIDFFKYIFWGGGKIY